MKPDPVTGEATVAALTAAPIPSWPRLPEPQQRAVSSDSRAHVCSLPALTATAPANGTLGWAGGAGFGVTGVGFTGTGVMTGGVGVGDAGPVGARRVSETVKAGEAFICRPFLFSMRTRRTTLDAVPLACPLSLKVRVLADPLALAVARTTNLRPAFCSSRRRLVELADPPVRARTVTVTVRSDTDVFEIWRSGPAAVAPDAWVRPAHATSRPHRIGRTLAVMA